MENYFQPGFWVVEYCAHPAGVGRNLTTARRLNFSPCHALRSPSRLPRMRIRCASSSYLDPSANEPAKPSRALENAADAPPPPLNGTFAHRPRRARHTQFGASRLPRTSYALLRTTQAHRDTPTVANHPRPRRPTDRLCKRSVHVKLLHVFALFARIVMSRPAIHDERAFGVPTCAFSVHSPRHDSRAIRRLRSCPRRR